MEDVARKPFVRRRAAVRMDPDAAARQGRAASLAFAAFGNGDSARAFLNTEHPDLGERPIDLAVASAAGLASVEHAIATRDLSAPAAKPAREPSENPDRGMAG